MDRSFLGLGDSVFGEVAALVLSQAPLSAAQSNRMSGIPDTAKKIIHDFVCDGLKDGGTKEDVVTALCKLVHSEVKIVPGEACEMVLKRLWEHEEVGLCKAAPVKAAELRRWEGSDNCTGNYSVLNHDNMNECTPKYFPAPASYWVEQKNETAYSSFHCQGVLDCSKDKRELFGDFIVGTCEDFGGYSQMRVWIKAESKQWLVI
jgi:hypothetical protein